MRIKKVQETTPLSAEVLNAENNSTKNTYSCDYINSMDRYSTTEVKTNKVWINGSPIYRRVIQDTLDNNAVTIQGIYITEIHGLVKSIYNQWWPLPAVYTETQYNLYLYLTSNRDGFCIDFNGYYTTNSPYEVVIEYVKISV